MKELFSSFSFEHFSGQTKEHVTEISNNILLHPKILSSWESMCAQATKDGFELCIASAFRSFDSQLRIWNEKVTGVRVIRDEKGNILSKQDFEALPSLQRLTMLLRWSALPGTSRHHWGTDLDIYDKKSIPPGYKLSLTPQEAEKNGVFFKFNQWLESNLEMFSFSRPYVKDLGGVRPEWWHISYAPLASQFERLDYLDELKIFLNQKNIAFKETILSHLPMIDRQFVKNISP